MGVGFVNANAKGKKIDASSSNQLSRPSRTCARTKSNTPPLPELLAIDGQGF